jgi:2-polyprenyl-6-methoxyphenol hydroxylase-like FAD-dependent oxidoreductase
MFKHRETDVLVVGAGPVGLAAAWMLLRRNISIDVIDERFEGEDAEVARHAVLLHSRTLELLADEGDVSALLDAGAQVNRVVVRDEIGERGVVRLDRTDSTFPFALAVDQDTLVRELRRSLAEARKPVKDAAHLAELDEGESRARVKVEQYGMDSGGFSSDGHLYTLEKVREEYPRFVIGADGAHSLTRREFSISFHTVGPRRSFIAVEMDTPMDLDGAAYVLVRRDTFDALWPLPGGRCRWTLELLADDEAAIGARDARRPFEVPIDLVRRYLRERAPWFGGSFADDDYAVGMSIEPGYAHCFGLGRLWLAGDAAHVTSPIGVQSLNAGIAEARELADRLERVLRKDEPPTLLDAYDADRRSEWERLFGPDAVWRKGDVWSAEHARRLVGALPATGSALIALASQLGFSAPLEGIEIPALWAHP